MVIIHVWYFGLRGHSGEIAGKFYVRPFSPLSFAVESNIWFLWGGVVFWHLWIGSARHPGPGAVSFAVDVFNVGGWLTHGDLVLDTEVDFLAVVEHRLIPARVRGERARHRGKGLATVWPLLLRILPMLVMLELGLSVSGVLLSFLAYLCYCAV